MTARAALISIAAGYFLWLLGSMLEPTNMGRLLAWVGILGFGVGFLIMLIKILR